MKQVLADVADLPDDLFDHLGDTEKRELGRFLVKTLKSQVCIDMFVGGVTP